MEKQYKKMIAGILNLKSVPMCVVAKKDIIGETMLAEKNVINEVNS